MARPKLPVVLEPTQKTELNRRLKAPGSTVQAALRARIVLLAAEGYDNTAIATRLETSRPTVGLWRGRFLDLGLDGLESLPRSGRPSSSPATRLPN